MRTAEEEARFQEERRSGLGGSDVGAVVGIDGWRTAEDVWKEKVLGVGQETGEAAWWGSLLEQTIGEEYARREDVKIIRPVPALWRLPSDPWAIAHPDFFVDGADIGVDVKMTDPRFAKDWGREGSDQVPDRVLGQVMWYMGITGRREWHVPVLIGNRLRVYRVGWNEDLWTALIGRCREFWTRYVLTRTPPPLEASERAQDLVEAVYPKETTPLRGATPAEDLLAMAYRIADAHMDDWEGTREAIRALLCAAIGPADGLQGPWGKITWRKTRDGETVDWQQAYRDLARMVRDLSHDKEAATTTLAERLKKFTQPKPGSRRFLPQFVGTPDQDLDPRQILESSKTLSLPPVEAPKEATA